MKQIKQWYRQYYTVLSNGIFPVLLFFYPFMTVAQGVDVSDSMYSFSNFMFFDQQEGMWMVSTYVANVVGWILTKLPFGTALLGIKIYTTLLISMTALLVYVTFRKWMPDWVAFAGEMLAIGFCWIPAGILYNYLSYLLFALGAIFLYQGLVEEKDKWLLAAGFSLGINVFVRIPNLTEMALIIGLWYYLAGKHRSLKVIVEKTAKCAAGYVAGMAIPLTGILFQYGISGIAEMILGLRNIQNSDSSYSLWTMITSVWDAYGRTLKWILLIGAGVAMGMGMFFCLRGKLEICKKTVYVAGMLVLLRFLWGRGMFSFRYYEDYSSMYEWGMVGLYLIWLAAIYMLISKKNTLEEKLWAVLVLVITAVTPLGSNNYTFQNLNNLFLTAPFALYTYVKIVRRRPAAGTRAQVAFPWKAMLGMLGVMIALQSTGFHSQFAFRDGMDGEPRQYRFQAGTALSGMRTTKSNGEPLEALVTYMQEQERMTETGIFYGDCPGMSFLLQLPSAISTPWPDLASYAYDTFVQELEAMEGAPVVILKVCSTGGEQSVKKKEYLLDFLQRNQYEKHYDNGTYQVYAVKAEK